MSPPSRPDLPAVTLRPVRADDRELLLRIYARTRREELSVVPWSEAEKAEFLRQQFEAQDLHYRQHYGGARFDVVLVDGEPAGRLYVDRWPGEIRLMDIALLPEYRGRGVGGRLIGELLDEGAAAGKAVSVHVERNNPARRLYARLGFLLEGENGIYDLMVWRPPEGGGGEEARLR